MEQSHKDSVREATVEERLAKQFVYFANCCFNSCMEQSHKDSVREATVEEQLAKQFAYFAVWSKATKTVSEKQLLRND